MEILKQPSTAQNKISTLKSKDSLGFVPTMGALHDGHLSLIKRSQKENNYTVVSIFLNPTQFNNPEDLNSYPQVINEDIKKLESLGVDCLFLPSFADIYPDEYNYEVIEKDFSQKLCGADRPGHFNGVLTIVLKLLMITMPTKAYFGEKDFQQFQLIKKMCQAFFIPTEVIPCPTLRDSEGLAMSSRNSLLSTSELTKAHLFAKTLKEPGSASNIKEKLTSLGFKIDYIEDHEQRRFAAVHVGKVRLIDNVPL